MSIVTEGNYADEALLVMKSRVPNPDGTIGVTINPDMPEWRAWQAYLLGKRMDIRASYMRSRGDKGYMVPCHNPGDFDINGINEARGVYANRLRAGEIPGEDTSRPAHQIPFAERERMANSLAAVGARLEAKMRSAFGPRRQARDARDETIPAPVEPRKLTDAEYASMRRVAGLPPIEDAAE